MTKTNKQEVWLRGPLPEVPPLLQPVAHALLQARDEVNDLMTDFPEIFLWVRPVEMASVGIHLQHLTGVIDRLFTYARGASLTDSQLEALKAEGRIPKREPGVNELLQLLNVQIDKAVEQLSNTSDDILTDVRRVGRNQIASTVIGLYVHAAEHTMRHVGQLLVTVKVLKN